MRALWLVALLAAPALSGCFAQRDLLGKSVPPFALTTSEGERVNETSFQGRFLALDLMATWCAPCREQARELRAAKQEQGARLAILSADVDPSETPADLETFAAANNFSWPHGVDIDGSVGRAMLVKNIPKLILVDPAGHVVLEQDVAADGVVRAAAIARAMR